MNRQQKVLVIDDDETFVKLIAARLKELGVELVVASSGLSGEI